MKRALLGGAAVTIACLALTACGGSSSSGRGKVQVKPPPAEGEKIKSPDTVMKEDLSGKEE